MIKVPLTPGMPRFELQVLLDSVTYTLEIRRNERSGEWHMDLLDESGETMIAGGLALVLGAAIGRDKARPAPPGFFILVDTSGRDEEAGADDLGDRVQLKYVTAADVAAMGI